MKEIIIESLKEGLRIIYLAAYPIILSGINIQTGAIDINWFIVRAVVIVAILKSIDDFVHRIGKEQNKKLPLNEESFLVKGITRF